MLVLGILIAAGFVIAGLIQATPLQGSTWTPSPIVTISPSPSVVTPSPSSSSTSESPSATPSATPSSATPTSPAPSTAAPSTSAPSLPEPVACDVNQPDGVKNLAACKVKNGGKTYTALEVFDICRASANASMWQVSGGKFGAELPIDKVERYITICLNGADLNDKDASPSVLGYPVKDKKPAGALRYILLVGGYGDSEEMLLYDANTGKALDDDKAKAEVIAWNSHGVG